MSLSLVRQVISKQGRSIRPYNQSNVSFMKSTCVLLARRQNSSAAPMKEVDNNYPHKEHIILPNPGLQTFKTTAKVLPSQLAEQFAILKACISSGSMERAERIMFDLYKTKAEEMKLFGDVNIYNNFLNGFVEAPQKPLTKQCLSWFDNMKVYGLNPDQDTYAIIIKGFLK